jgi:hypothetical protein
MTGAYSDNLSQHQLVSDPGGLGSEILAGSLAVELEHLRFCIKRITGKAQWYIAPLTDLESGVADNVITNAKLADMAQDRIKGRISSGSGDPEDLTGANVRTIANAVNKAGDTLDGRLVSDNGGATGNNVIATSTTGLGEIEILNNGTGAAMMSFHRSGSWAEYLGLDTDNKWKVGGWSAGANSYEIWTKRNSYPARAWGKAGVAGDLLGSFGISSVTDGGTGLITWNWTTAFSSANYSVTAVALDPTGGNQRFTKLNSMTTTSCQQKCINQADTAVDPDNFLVAAHGDQ